MQIDGDIDTLVAAEYLYWALVRSANIKTTDGYYHVTVGRRAYDKLENQDIGIPPRTHGIMFHVDRSEE